MRTESRPRRRDRVLAQTAAGSLVLLNPESGRYYTLDEVGARIWELCDGTRTLSEIADIVAAEYEAPRETIGVDARELLDELVDERLLVAEDEA